MQEHILRYASQLLEGVGMEYFWNYLGLAIFGVVLKSSNIKINGKLSIISYLLMGWIILIALPLLLNSVTYERFLILLAGGMAYTFGAIFFVLDKFVSKTRLFGMHEIFHIFVLIGSFLHFWFMLKYLI